MITGCRSGRGASVAIHADSGAGAGGHRPGAATSATAAMTGIASRAAASRATCGILPRLGLATAMVDSVLAELRGQLRAARLSNRRLASRYDPGNASHVRSFSAEHAIRVALGALGAARLGMSGVGSIRDIPGTLPQALYVVRMSGASLSEVSAECGRTLSEASVHLGSVILDAALISGSRLDLGRSNRDASRLFDQAKLTADSKLRKQYPKLGILGACSRCY